MANDDPLWGTFDELYQHLFDALEPLKVDDVDTLIASLEPYLEPYIPETEETSRGVNQDLMGKRFYAIHNGDLRYMFLIGGLIAGMAGAGMGALSYVGSIVGVGLQYRRKRVELSALQGIVLSALLEHGGTEGLDPEGLRTHLPPQIDLDHTQISAILEELADIKRLNGERTRLVDRKGNQWWTVDL